MNVRIKLLKLAVVYYAAAVALWFVNGADKIINRKRAS